MVTVTSIKNASHSSNKMKLSLLNSLGLIILFVIVSLNFSGCSEDSVVNVEPEEVAGTFDFTTYTFTPDAAAIQPAIVLDTLAVENTNLRLIAGGQFILSYQFIDGPESVIIGDFTATENEIRLTVGSGNNDRLTSLLLHTPLVFNRSANKTRLTHASTRTVDLSAFSNRYSGIPPITGQLELELLQRSASASD